MAFTPERVDWRRVIIPNLLLLGVVSHAHPDVVVTGTAVHILEGGPRQDGHSMKRTTRY